MWNREELYVLRLMWNREELYVLRLMWNREELYVLRLMWNREELYVLMWIVLCSKSKVNDGAVNTLKVLCSKVDVRSVKACKLCSISMEYSLIPELCSLKNDEPAQSGNID